MPASREQGSAAGRPAQPWTILIVDDEEQVHAVTKLVLRDLEFEGRPVEFTSSYSAAQTMLLFESGLEVAVILLDVVMENDRAGLDIVRYIRETRKNQYTRIILRTGQPGSAPERSVIDEYDINDYKEKSELTSVKLYSCVMSALRSYRDIMAIDQAKRGLESIIRASSTLFKTELNLSSFVSAILEELHALLQTSHSFFYIKSEGFAAVGTERSVEIVSGSEAFRDYLHRTVDSIEEKQVHDLVMLAIEGRQSHYLDNEYVGFFKSRMGFEIVLYIRTNDRMSGLDKNLLHVFSTNIALAFDNLILNKDIIDTQKEIVCTIGDVVETRSHETANHVKRVAEFAYALAGYAGMDDTDRALLHSAAPLHDLGKIGIPDGIMLKAGVYDPDEWEAMKQHTVIGYDILRSSKREILQAAGTIAHQHHERWDGKGYPAGLAGEDIHIFARIIAIVDVFDALLHRRSYKDAWPPVQAREYIEGGAGSQLDPRLVGLFLEHFDEFMAINERYPEYPRD